MIKDKETTVDVLKTIERNIEYYGGTINDIKETEGGLVVNNKIISLNPFEMGACLALAKVYYSIRQSHNYANNESIQFAYVECMPCFKEGKECCCLTC